MTRLSTYSGLSSLVYQKPVIKLNPETRSSSVSHECEDALERPSHTRSNGTFKYTEEETGDHDVGVVLVSEQGTPERNVSIDIYVKARLDHVGSLDHGDNTNTPDKGGHTENCIAGLGISDIQDLVCSSSFATNLVQQGNDR
jgi:hypothetical protein